MLLMKKGEISEAFNRVEKLISQQTSQSQPDMYARYVFDAVQNILYWSKKYGISEAFIGHWDNLLI